jgi:hypothetical protein
MHRAAREFMQVPSSSAPFFKPRLRALRPYLTHPLPFPPFSSSSPPSPPSSSNHAQHKGAGLGWTTAAISMLQTKAAALNAEKAVREERIMVIGQQITALWKRLSTPEEEQTSFLESHAGIGDDVIAACEDYLAAKQSEFAARLVDLIGGARQTIAGIWTELRWGEEQKRVAFADFYAPSDDFSDDLFLRHEGYIAAATAALDEARPLLKAVEKREAILGERAEYEALMADPQRLLIKGSSAARLREEKLERRVKKELPAVTKRLRQQCVEWEAAHGGTHFVVDGARYIDVIDAEEAADAKAKDEARHRREARTAGGAEENAGAGSAAASSAAAAASSSAAAASASAGGLGATRSTSAPIARPSVYRPNILNATNAGGAAGAGAAAAKPRLPAAVKKTSVPATMPGSSSSSSSVAPSSFNDDLCTVVSGASASEPKPAASVVSAAAPKAAAPPAPAPLGTINANKSRAAAPAAGSKSVVGKTVEAHVSGEAEKAASVILSAL